MDASALQRCVGDVEEFFDRHWDRAPLLRESTDPGAFDDLASLDDLDHMVTSLGLRPSTFRMVKDGKTLPASSYTTPPGRSSRSAEGFVSGALVYERFGEGATIVLESLHRYWRPLTDFCRELELTVGHRLQVNAYLTPPGSQGFDVHRDSHDVFVLQVWGSKHWTVYDRDLAERVLIDQTIPPGTCLYIPQGFPHAASTDDRASAHLTVGILTHESIDVVRELAKLAEEDPAFRRRLPAQETRDIAGLRRVVETELDEVRAWLDKVDVDDLTQQVARRVMSTSQPVVRGQLRQSEYLGQMNGDTRVARRRGATCVVFRRNDSLCVLLADRELEMPLAVEPAMTEIERRDAFQVRDLYHQLDPGSALLLVRRLVREGLLEVVLGR